MPDKTKEMVLDELIAMSHHLGEEWREYLIIGEGNTSARIDQDTFFVKASGANLRTATADGFVHISRSRAMTLLDGNANDMDVKRVLSDARVDPSAKAHPSVETVLHAALYDLTDAQFIGHTHPIAVNAVMCSKRAEDITCHLMPDEIVVCGVASIFIPYTDPGLALAREVCARVRAFIAEYGEQPRTMYLQNHGLFALGQSARQVQNVTAMAVKHARVLAGTYAVGGPNFLSDHDISRIHTRPDEEVRRMQFK
ncbi:MAG: class II aldolase/adducin family protein [Chloroflexi bacterium]|nr:class II aldolase/adducin family protein [Chloroflexota bacterium]